MWPVLCVGRNGAKVSIKTWISTYCWRIACEGWASWSSGIASKGHEGCAWAAKSRLAVIARNRNA